ncbi:hypothetical protein MK280_09610 [Myxococcota bacterium]|nr:hypothetical protein [Myxococcota bacterium]
MVKRLSQIMGAVLSILSAIFLAADVRAFGANPGQPFYEGRTGAGDVCTEVTALKVCSIAFSGPGGTSAALDLKIRSEICFNGNVSAVGVTGQTVVTYRSEYSDTDTGSGRVANGTLDGSFCLSLHPGRYWWTLEGDAATSLILVVGDSS